MMRAALFVLMAVALAATASAQGKWEGRWRDNAPSPEPAGALTISETHFRFAGHVAYRVSRFGDFGEGDLFKIEAMDRKTDPFGCGADGKVKFLAVAPLPKSAGAAARAIRVFFYAGDAPPTPESIRSDLALCSIHPFGRS